MERCQVYASVNLVAGALLFLGVGTVNRRSNRRRPPLRQRFKSFGCRAL